MAAKTTKGTTKAKAAAGDGAAAYGVYRDALGGEDILGEMPEFDGLDARHQAAWNAVAGAPPAAPAADAPVDDGGGE